MPDLESARSSLQILLLGLQAVQVTFLWVHDWIPLGSLNDVAAVRSQDSFARLSIVTLVQSLPFTLVFLASAQHLGHPYPSWLMIWLWVSYALLLLGQFRAWWLPYLFRPEPERTARYLIMFGNTHAFLPQRNGLVPNTAHVLLHIATIATLFVLLAMSR
jgi:hypothetical protein